jgi:hypothetical protein
MRYSWFVYGISWGMNGMNGIIYNEGDYLNQLITGGWPHCVENNRKLTLVLTLGNGGKHLFTS